MVSVAQFSKSFLGISLAAILFTGCTATKINGSTATTGLETISAANSSSTLNTTFSTEALQSPTERLLALSAYLQTIGFDPDTSNRFQLATELRNFVYRKVALGVGTRGLNFSDFENSFRIATTDPSAAQICGGLTILYMSALEALRIPARYVGIFSSTLRPYDSHTSVEFFVDGKWYASDPTFNVMFESDGAFLNYSEVFALLEQGYEPVVTSNDFPTISGRTVDDYYISIKDLYKFMVLHPGDLDDTDNQRPTFLPSSWNGYIENEDVSNYCCVYEELKALRNQP